MLEIIETMGGKGLLGLAMVGVSLVMAFIWFVTLFYRVNWFSWLFAWIGSPMFWIGETLMHSDEEGGGGVFSFFVKTLIVFLVLLTCTATAKDKQQEKAEKNKEEEETEIEKRKEKRHEEKMDDLLWTMKHSSKYAEMDRELSALLEEDRVIEIHLVRAGLVSLSRNGVMVRYTESSPPYSWDVSNGTWKEKPYKRLYFFRLEPGEREFTEDENLVLEQLVRELVKKHAVGQSWRDLKRNMPQNRRPY